MSQALAPTLRLLLVMFDEVELLDFAGPYEVFSAANRVAAVLEAESGPEALRLPRFELVTASLDGRPVRARAGLQLTPDHALADAPACDWLIVPGGVVDALLDDAPTLREIRRRADAARCVASVCTGAFVLAEAGVLHHCEATTHWEDLPTLAQRQPDLQLRPDLRWVDNGHVVTSAGISAGIDMSLHLVRRAAGGTLARRTARQMDTPYREHPTSP